SHRPATPGATAPVSYGKSTVSPEQLRERTSHHARSLQPNADTQKWDHPPHQHPPPCERATGFSVPHHRGGLEPTGRAHVANFDQSPSTGATALRYPQPGQLRPRTHLAFGHRPAPLRPPPCTPRSQPDSTERRFP